MDFRLHPVLAAVSSCYSEPKGRFPRVTHPCATKARRPSFDLHVLGMPPAFVLSQDQTLKFDARSPIRWKNPTGNRSTIKEPIPAHHIFLSGYVTRHTNWLSTLTISKRLECPENRQAAARMSLHLNHNVKEPDNKPPATPRQPRSQSPKCADMSLLQQSVSTTTAAVKPL